MLARPFFVVFAVTFTTTALTRYVTSRGVFPLTQSSRHKGFNRFKNTLQEEKLIPGFRRGNRIRFAAGPGQTPGRRGECYEQGPILPATWERQIA